MPTNIQSIINEIKSIQTQTEEGEINAVEGYILLKTIQKSLDDIKDYLYAGASKSFAGMNKQEMENLPFGAKCRETSRSTYSYDENEKYKAKNEELKKYEKLIKIATDNQSAIADPDTGEMIYAVPFKTSTTYAITIK